MYGVAQQLIKQTDCNTLCKWTAALSKVASVTAQTIWNKYQINALQKYFHSKHVVQVNDIMKRKEINLICNLGSHKY